MIWRLLVVPWLLLIVGCSGAPPAETPPAADPGRPNVLFVFYDQYRTDIIGAYGGGDNITTPNIDRLADEGALFTNGLSTTPVCTPYRGMLMTGRHPTHTGLMLNFLEANTSVRGVADIFADAGYRTASRTRLPSGRSRRRITRSWASGTWRPAAKTTAARLSRPAACCSSRPRKTNNSARLPQTPGSCSGKPSCRLAGTPHRRPTRSTAGRWAPHRGTATSHLLCPSDRVGAFHRVEEVTHVE